MKRRMMVVCAALMCLMALTAGCSKPNTVDAMKPHVAVRFTYAGGLRYSPSYAVWVEDESGNLATLYATQKVASGKWGPDRANVLPIWSGVKEDKVDAVAGATPAAVGEIQCNLPAEFAGKKLKLYIEANASYDYNDYYAEGQKSGDEGYNDVNGQPSMLWMAELDPAAVRGEAVPVLIGAGDVMGADHAVHEDLGHATTARELLKDITVKFDFIQ